MKTKYRLEKSELDEFIYFQALGSTAYKFHYFEICFTVPFFLLLTYECFEHLHTSFGKLILTLLAMAWLFRGSDWFWKSKVHCFAENRSLPFPICRNEISFQFDTESNTLLINQQEINELTEFQCLQSCMIIHFNQQTFLIPWRIFESDEIKGQFVKTCMKKKSSSLSYSHKEA